MKAPDHSPPAHPARLILILSLAPTVGLGIGQTLGPIAVGAVTDAFGSLSYALNLSAAMLAVGAIAAAFQKKLPRTSS